MGEGIMWGKKRVTGCINWEHWRHMVLMRMTVFMLKTKSLGYAHARAKRIFFVVFCLMSRHFNTTIWILLYDACNGFSVTLKKSAQCNRNIGVIQKGNVLSSFLFNLYDFYEGLEARMLVTSLYIYRYRYIYIYIYIYTPVFKKVFI